MSKIAELKIELRGTTPTVWRVIQVPLGITFRRLHQAINVAVGWNESHLHLFEVGGDQIGNTEWDDMDEWIPDTRIKLADVIEQHNEFTYRYDFGDGWSHKVTIENVIEGDPSERYPVCVKGANACPPEDCGGPPGFAEFKEAISNPKHPRHAELLEWYSSWEEEPYDPKSFSVEKVNKYLPGRRKLKASQ